MYIVMEYIKGKTLEEIIQSLKEPLSERKILYLVTQLCEILFYLHTLSPEPVIFRDLKPGNLMITEEDIVKVIDFGVARRYDPEKDSDTVRLGTPGYAAPEQCRKKGQSTPRSDIYALGVVLHQLLSLCDPTVTPFKLPPLRNVRPEISEELENIVNKAIALDPGNRYLDAGLFRDKLTDYYRDKYGTFMSPYNKLVSIEKDQKIFTPVKRESLFKKLVKKHSNFILPMAIGGVAFLVYIFLFYPQFYSCTFPFTICVVLFYLILREF